MGRAEVVRDYGGISAEDRRAERRRKLLEAGRQAWGESGLADVTVRGVCAAAKLTPRYFYEHFPNRDALVVAVADELYEGLFDVLVGASLAESGGLEDKLRAALKALLDTIADDPHIHRILTSDWNGIPGLVERRTKTLDVITDLVLHYGADLIEFEPESAETMRRGALFVVGGVNQLIVDWLRDPKESTAELADSCTWLCLTVVTAGRAAAKRDIAQ
ncbi:TetR/AcrR family transcriptional regulator [Hoyosella altamirensis]|uniref:TetR/AcrR family transcriptional regulator n=1 Tax=Hoyosella altamirensis TaxID=616997 RepID=UPI0007DB3935|nr:TetR/AcrR family transcriptional regulator [Hoyosella altamirensis]